MTPTPISKKPVSRNRYLKQLSQERACHKFCVSGFGVNDLPPLAIPIIWQEVRLQRASSDQLPALKLGGADNASKVHWQTKDATKITVRTD